MRLAVAVLLWRRDPCWAEHKTWFSSFTFIILLMIMPVQHFRVTSSRTIGRIACRRGWSSVFGIGTSHLNCHQSAVILASHILTSRSYISLWMSSVQCFMSEYVSPVSPPADLLDLDPMARKYSSNDGGAPSSVSSSASATLGLFGTAVSAWWIFRRISSCLTRVPPGSSQWAKT